MTHIQIFRSLGGKQAIKESARIAIALLCEIFGSCLFTEMEIFAYLTIRALRNSKLNILRSMLNKNINAPITASIECLFDYVALLLGMQQQIDHVSS